MYNISEASESRKVGRSSFVIPAIGCDGHLINPTVRLTTKEGDL